jgi:hypothetical protein
METFGSNLEFAQAVPKIAKLLALIANPPHERNVPSPLSPGSFLMDTYFDGGKWCDWTGYRRFEFDDGSIADASTQNISLELPELGEYQLKFVKKSPSSINVLP